MLPLQATRLLMLPFIHPLHLTWLLPLLLRATRPLPPLLLPWHLKLLLQQQVYSVSSSPQVTNTDCQFHSNYVPTKIMLTYSAPIAIHTKNYGRDYSAPERQASLMYTLKSSLLTTHVNLPLLLLLLVTQFLALLLHTQRSALEVLTS